MGLHHSHPGVVVRLWHHILQEMGLAGTLGWRPVSWRENWSATHKVKPPGHPPHWTVEVQTEGCIVLDHRVRGVPSISPTHTQSNSSASFYTVSSSRGRLRSPSPCVDPWEAQRTLERGNFIEGVLSVSPGPSITCHPVGLTSSGGHVLLGHTGRPLPWL